MGATPTEAGLQLLPLMLGLIITSIASGRIITHTGKYRIFPIIGTAVATLGMWLLSTINPTSGYWYVALGSFVLGFGLGNVMQVLLLAVQNSVPIQQMGAATSTSTFFRSIGGTIGTAVFGAIFTAQLTNQLASRLPPGAQDQLSASGQSIESSTANIADLPPAIHEPVIYAFSDAITTTFLFAVPVLIASFALALFLKETPLKTHPGVEATLADDAPQPLD